jgi:hypothetical protein
VLHDASTGAATFVRRRARERTAIERIHGRVLRRSYCVRFEDSMAYGTHHYLTNFRFQCIARETLYLAEAADGTLPHEEDRAAIRLLTTEGPAETWRPFAWASASRSS